MNLLFVIGSLSCGGAERVVAELSNYFVYSNDVGIIMLASNTITYPVSDKVRIIPCYDRNNIKGLSFLKRVSNLRKIIIEANPDYVISFTTSVNIYAILSCLFSKEKLIISERNDPRYDPKNKVERFMRKLLYRFAEGVVFQTIGERDYFSNSIRRKSCVIPNPINPDIPNSTLKINRKRVVCASRLVSQKNVKMAIDAFKIVSDHDSECVFDIYGDGPLKRELQQYVFDKGLDNKIVFKGNSRSIFQDIQNAGVFLISSNYEGISNTMLEAMALGIPTISTDYSSGGARETIEDGVNGFLVPCGDSTLMAEYMIKIIDNPELASSISKEAKKIRSKYDICSIGKMWEDYFKTISEGD